MMVDLISRCWHQDPRMRPTFEQIIEEKVLTRGTFPISLKGLIEYPNSSSYYKVLLDELILHEQMKSLWFASCEQVHLLPTLL